MSVRITSACPECGRCWTLVEMNPSTASQSGHEPAADLTELDADFVR